MTWSFRHIALLAFAKNDGHDAVFVAAAIKHRCVDAFQMDIDSVARFAMSDTTASARNVSLQFDDTLQTDCCMHILNLCIGYGVGLKENTRRMFTGDGSEREKVSCVVTPDGPLPQGAEVIKKLRALNNHFKSPQRPDRLKELQAKLGYPSLRPIVDVDMHVASSCLLMKRSIVNYAAFKTYFRKHTEGRDVFAAISVQEWGLVVELEAITEYLAKLALLEVQHEAVVSSYLLVFRKMSLARLQSASFDCYMLDAERDPDTNEASMPRTRTPIEQFSQGGLTCIRRLQVQILSRFPALSRDVAMPLLLDPRTKNSAVTLPSKMTEDDDGDGAIIGATALLKQEHLELLTRMRESEARERGEQGEGNKRRNGSAINDVNEQVADLYGDAVPSAATKDVSAASLQDESNEIIERWMAFKENWLSVAAVQKVHGVPETELVGHLCARRHDGSLVWDLMGLYKHVNIYRWYRDVGAKAFPSIALLARIWLGRSSSTAFQERVFSSGTVVMSPLRARTDNELAEKQLILCHNVKEIVRLSALR